MPMAGEASRFRKEGVFMPKPLLTIDGKFFFMNALTGFPEDLLKEARFSFIVRDEHILAYNIDRIITQAIHTRYGEGVPVSIFSVRKTTRGAAETVAKAIKNIEGTDIPFIVDCDLCFKAPESYWKFISGDPITNALLTFNSQDPKYSYVESDVTGLGYNVATETAEKQVISNDAIAGVYMFASGNYLKIALNKLLRKKNIDSKELYISLLYNSDVVPITRVYKIDELHSVGTPEEYAEYINYLNTKES